MKKNIAIFEKDEINCRAIKSIFYNHPQYQIEEVFTDPELLKSTLKKLKSELIIIRLDGDTTQLEIASMIRNNNVPVKVVLLAESNGEFNVIEALKTGAHGILTLDMNYKLLFEAIQIVFSGGAYLSPLATKQLFESYHVNLRTPFSAKEMEIVRYLSDGNTYTEIGTLVGISKETVKSHVKNIYRKAKVNKKSELIRHAKVNRIVR